MMAHVPSFTLFVESAKALFFRTLRYDTAEVYETSETDGQEA
jgi:hypothetical protein